MSLVRPVGRTCLAAAAMGVALAFARGPLADFAAAHGWGGVVSNLAQLIGLMALGAVVYFAIVALFMLYFKRLPRTVEGKELK